jgi:hypothetical protein
MQTFLLAMSAWVLIAFLIGIVVGPFLVDRTDQEPY